LVILDQEGKKKRRIEGLWNSGFAEGIKEAEQKAGREIAAPAPNYVFLLMFSLLLLPHRLIFL
jgi:hypothetical protein